MRNFTRRLGRWSWTCGLAVIGLAIAGMSTAAWAQDLPEGKGKEIVESECSSCHGLKQVSEAKFTPEEWKEIVQQMVDNGAPLTEDDVAVVIDYLAKNFPKSTPPEKNDEKADEKININKAAAKELVDSLKLTAEEADAVVKYRSENGAFAKFEDLEKVPGLDSKKLEPIKDRLTY